MKEKILAAIKAKFPNVNLSKKRLDAIAAKIEEKVIDDETKIDAQLDAFNDYSPLADIAKEDDKVRNLEAKLKTAAPAKKEETPKEETQEEKPADEVPAWAKALLTEVQTLKAEKAQTSRQQKLTTAFKDVPAYVNWKDWKQPETDEEETVFIEKVNTRATEMAKEFTEKGLSVLSAPKTGSSSAGDSKQASKEEIAAVVKDIM